MAGALKESAGAKLVGEQTFGKGTVQLSYKLGDGGLVKITIAKWLTPEGHWIHQKGIEPDIVVHQPEYYSVAPLPRDKMLKFAMDDADVKSMQLMLDGLGYKPGRTDGYFSKATEAALKSFQRAAGLSATGQVDAKTAEKLEADILKAMQDPKNDAQLKKAIETVKQETR
jgi:carboxyl-terminal processing protease